MFFGKWQDFFFLSYIEKYLVFFFLSVKIRRSVEGRTEFI